jgi:hypothetical protein
MTAEMDSLRSSIDSMSSKLAQAESSARSANADVKDAVAALRTELATLRGSLSDIDARVKAIEDRPPATGEKIAALAVAAGQLETAVDSGNPYDGAFNSLKALAAGDTVIEQTLAALEKSTRTGIPTVADLSRHFEEIAPSLMVPATDSAGGGWVETLRAKARSLVNMRPVGDAGDSSPVTRAERALAKNDLAAAVAALDGVPGLAVGWQEQAQSRLDADAALAAVRARIVERLAAETQTADSAGTAKRGTP